MTTKTIMSEVRNNKSSESVTTYNNIDQALDARDAIAKSLYSTLFTWLVTRVNKIIGGGTTGLSRILILSNSRMFGMLAQFYHQLCLYNCSRKLISFAHKIYGYTLTLFTTYLFSFVHEDLTLKDTRFQQVMKM